MNNTFITENDKNWIEGMKVRSGNIIKKVNDLRRDAIDEIVNLFEGMDVNSIDVENYDGQFEITLTDDFGYKTRKLVKRVELEDGIIYLVDEDGVDHESVEWSDEAPELLWVLVECLETKLSDIQNLAVGKKVRWIDPAIEDYDEEFREDMLNRIFTIYSCPDVIERDSVIGISCDGISEAEVLPMELVLMPE